MYDMYYNVTISNDIFITMRNALEWVYESKLLTTEFKQIDGTSGNRYTPANSAEIGDGSTGIYEGFVSGVSFCVCYIILCVFCFVWVCFFVHLLFFFSAVIKPYSYGRNGKTQQKQMRIAHTKLVVCFCVEF